ncbi:Pleiotropic drug resistance protein 2 [Camellia lanceoleosa]|uniref:Pleiotropic drug resistance protein 2 n=1 Tax=Camellia lanceoleosa TaxID=1840588 RepID=A0ACC0FKU9_9ERIC|nr:Pleiotropic drug resistance protein 2 [Camellia lanceoleosa]
MTLLLGPPSSGKTSLLLALGGKLDSDLNRHHVGQQLGDELAVPFDKAKCHPAALTTKKLFKMYLLMLFVNQMASAMFRLIRALGRNMIVANVFGSFALLAVLVLCGYILSRAQGIPDDRLELSKGVSVTFRPGILTALMGVSGADKTTLMDVLASRKTGGYIDGSITISGEALVGLPSANGLSTEQRKRLTIAIELVANLSIIFMDEPTLGFDGRAAAIVIRTVRNTMDTERTVVCTIHQPSIDIFDTFDLHKIQPRDLMPGQQQL